MLCFRLRDCLLFLAAVVISSSTDAGPIRNPGSNHYYEVIDQTINWQDARDAAQTRTFLGVIGDLAVIISAAENIFLTETFGINGLHAHWIGGVQIPGSSEPNEGWSWVNGEAFAYNNWAPGEPNNNSGNAEREDRILFDHDFSSDGKHWNDLPGSRLVAGYAVEYAVPVPEPSSAVLTGIAFSVIIAGARHRSRTKTEIYPLKGEGNG